MSRAKIVFLYSEVAGYFLACVQELAKHADVLIVRWPVNKEAPFKFQIIEGVEIIEKNKVKPQDLLQKVHQFNPSIVVCSGWFDKDYLKIAKSFGKKIPIVVSMDNHWSGTWRQKLACWISPFYLKRIFTHAWVPGAPQFVFAEKLGFNKKNIITNFYCADTPLFKEIFDETFELKKKSFPHRFLFVARYVKHKGIFELWNAFEQVCREQNTDWELWCIGTGEEWENKINHPKIKHLGFVQPNDLKKYIAETGVYILPSSFEPWGVSVQEFSICGFPLILTEQVGSGSDFLNHENGILCESKNVDSIRSAMVKLILKKDEDLIAMGEKSHELGMNLTTVLWSENILQLINKANGKIGD